MVEIWHAMWFKLYYWGLTYKMRLWKNRILDKGLGGGTSQGGGARLGGGTDWWHQVRMAHVVTPRCHCTGSCRTGGMLCPRQPASGQVRWRSGRLFIKEVKRRRWRWRNDSGRRYMLWQGLWRRQRVSEELVVESNMEINFFLLPTKTGWALV